MHAAPLHPDTARSAAATDATDSGALPRPLAGVRVVEFCQVAAGPFCAMLLADFGAEVIKVEPPGGDALRQWPPIRGGFSENFASLNRGKRSIVLDLKDAADRDLARSLVLDADVLVENNRPGAMQRLGLLQEGEPGHARHCVAGGRRRPGAGRLPYPRRAAPTLARPVAGRRSGPRPSRG